MDGSIDTYLNSLAASSMQRVSASLRHAVDTSAPDSKVHDFASQLLRQLEQGEPGSGTEAATRVGSDLETVDEIWQRVRAQSLAAGNGPGDAMLQSLRQRDDATAARRHPWADVGHAGLPDGPSGLFDGLGWDGVA